MQAQENDSSAGNVARAKARRKRKRAEGADAQEDRDGVEGIVNDTEAEDECEANPDGDDEEEADEHIAWDEDAGSASP